MLRLRKITMVGVTMVLASVMVFGAPVQHARAAVPAFLPAPLIGLGAEAGASALGATFTGFTGALFGDEAAGWVEKSFSMEDVYLGSDQWKKDENDKFWGYVGNIFGLKQTASIPFNERAVGTAPFSYFDHNYGPENPPPVTPGPMPDMPPDLWAQRPFTDSDKYGGDSTRGGAVKLKSLSPHPTDLRSIYMDFSVTAEFGSAGVTVNAKVEAQCRRTSAPFDTVNSNKTDYTFTMGRGVYTNAPVNKLSSLCNSGHKVVSVHVSSFKSDEWSQYLQNQTYVNPTNVEGSASWYSKDYEMVNPGYRTMVECVNPANGNVTKLYQDTPAGAGALIIPSCSEAGVGTYAQRIVTDFLEGGKVRRPMIEIKPKTTPFDGSTDWTDCDPRFGPICELSVWVDGKKCKSLAPECLDWLERYNVNPVDVQCKYGNRVVHISRCRGHEEVYKGHPVAPTGPNFDFDPSTSDPQTPTKPQVDPEKNPNFDPEITPIRPPSTDPDEHKVPVPDPTLPQPDPTPNPTPNPSGEPSGNPTATPSGPGFPEVGNNPQDMGADRCLSSQWTWNPFEWVQLPVTCALRSAFIPKTDIKVRVDGVVATASSRVPFVWVPTTVQGPTASGCPSWNIKVANVNKNVICDSPFIQAVVGSRGVMFGLISFVMVWPLIRSIWYGLIPIVRATPTK